MPWIIAETERLVIREFTAEDAAHMIQEDVGPGDEIFHRREKLTAYIDSQYRFFEYGIWAVVEKESMTVIGKAGLFQPTAEFLQKYNKQSPSRQKLLRRKKKRIPRWNWDITSSLPGGAPAMRRRRAGKS